MTKPNLSKIILPVEGRRGFLRVSSLGLAAIALGCGSSQSNPETPPGSDTGGGADPDTGGGTDSGTTTDSTTTDSGSATDAKVDDASDATPECRDTDDNIEGPFFKPSSPIRADLVDAGMKGVRITISGRVLAPGCGVALAGAIVDFWQADAAGAYFDAKLRGHQTTGADGRYSLHTIIPGHYLNGAQYRPAHIHVKVQAAGHTLLTTQLYFEGDPYNDIDPFIKKSLIMKVADAGGGAKASTFDFVLRKL